MTDQPAQVQIDPSKLKAGAITVCIAVVSVVSGATTLFGMLSKHDLLGVATFVQSEASVPFFTGLATLVSLAALFGRSYLSKWRQLYLSWHNDDRVSVTTTPIAEPAPPPSSVLGLVSATSNAKDL